MAKRGPKPRPADDPPPSGSALRKLYDALLSGEAVVARVVAYPSAIDQLRDRYGCQIERTRGNRSVTMTGRWTEDGFMTVEELRG